MGRRSAICTKDKQVLVVELPKKKVTTHLYTEVSTDAGAGWTAIDGTTDGFKRGTQQADNNQPAPGCRLVVSGHADCLLDDPGPGGPRGDVTTLRGEKARLPAATS